MRSFSNTYIFLFSVIMVIAVAVLLSFVAMQLKPLQDLNREIERKQDILASVKEGEEASEVKDKNSYVEGEFEKYINDSYVVNYSGDVVEGKDAFEVTLNLPEQADKDAEDRLYPVFVYTNDEGTKKYIVPVRGKGLWGPIWGYVSFRSDMNTMYGAIYDHQGETPGLGAEINTDWFEEEFEGKKIFDEQGNFVSVEVLKGKDTSNDPHAVDGISGGTITSDGVDDMLEDYLGGYVNHFKKRQAAN
ncbi:MAG TPA: NADH:ubiquinone reductase (Na(+)-transporting) subunit C [Bacteroidales bacterium]|nr:NADH:ubiquinone reductase (Na(+)-transporting) subunit C [Bacteroidales bacterium]